MVTQDKRDTQYQLRLQVVNDYNLDGLQGDKAA
jgi:hypothetical protein